MFNTLCIFRDSRQTHLPCPEEPILQGIHAGESKLKDAILRGLVPRRGILPNGAITPICRGAPYAMQEQATVIIPITEFPSNRDPKGRLAVTTPS